MCNFATDWCACFCWFVQWVSCAITASEAYDIFAGIRLTVDDSCDALIWRWRDEQLIKIQSGHATDAMRASKRVDDVVCKSGKLTSHTPAPIFSLFRIVVRCLSRLVLSVFRLVIVYLLVLAGLSDCQPFALVTFLVRTLHLQLMITLIMFKFQ